MYIMVLGLRAFPGVQGGVETHAQYLYPLLVEMGCQVDVLVRSAYVAYENDTYKGVRFRSLWSPRKSGIEAIVHSVLGVIYAGFRRPDILHIHAIGPSIVTPLARLLGLRVVVTHHGPDYDRDKWGALARSILRLGESLGMRYSTRRIVISRVIGDLVKRKYGLESTLIPNGVAIPARLETHTSLDGFGLAPFRYVLQVSRLVPEKRQLDLIKAFSIAGLPGWKLVLVGELVREEEYSQAVMSLAAQNPDVILTGFQTGEALQELFSSAGLFVLPSSHEGLPIALLEALSYGIPVLASDIPANLEIGLTDEHYFPLGDVSKLAASLGSLAVAGRDEEKSRELIRWLEEHYDWRKVAALTLGVYKRALAGEKR